MGSVSSWRPSRMCYSVPAPFSCGSRSFVLEALGDFGVGVLMELVDF